MLLVKWDFFIRLTVNLLDVRRVLTKLRLFPLVKLFIVIVQHIGIAHSASVSLPCHFGRSSCVQVQLIDCHRLSRDGLQQAILPTLNNLMVLVSLFVFIKIVIPVRARHNVSYLF